MPHGRGAHRHPPAIVDALRVGPASTLSDKTLWSKIAATPMIGQNDLPRRGLRDSTPPAALNTFVRDQELGRLSMWSLNRDITCGHELRRP